MLFDGCLVCWSPSAVLALAAVVVAAVVAVGGDFVDDGSVCFAN